MPEPVGYNLLSASVVVRKVTNKSSWDTYDGFQYLSSYSILIVPSVFGRDCGLCCLINTSRNRHWFGGRGGDMF